jgi:hypothetical protein
MYLIGYPLQNQTYDYFLRNNRTLLNGLWLARIVSRYN